MNIKSYHKSLTEQCRRSLNFSFINDIDPMEEEFIFCNDTDTVKYKILAKKDRFSLYIFFVDLEALWKYIEPYFRQHYYQRSCPLI
jgi:hypothetical protein